MSALPDKENDEERGMEGSAVDKLAVIEMDKISPRTDKTTITIHEVKGNVPWTVWATLFISSFGVFMAAVSTSALIIAFPVLLLTLNMTINTMMWVLLVLLLMIGAVVPTAGTPVPEVTGHCLTTNQYRQINLLYRIPLTCTM